MSIYFLSLAIHHLPYIVILKHVSILQPRQHGWFLFFVICAFIQKAQKATVCWSNSTEPVQKAEVQLEKLSVHKKHVLAFISTQIQNRTTDRAQIGSTAISANSFTKSLDQVFIQI